MIMNSPNEIMVQKAPCCKDGPRGKGCEEGLGFGVGIDLPPILVLPPLCHWDHSNSVFPASVSLIVNKR